MSDQYYMDSHKLYWHLDRVNAWQKGERIAPIHIDAGLSKGCNIKCQYCYGVTQGNFFKKGSEIVFPREALLNYMKGAGEVGVRSIALIGEAEPTLNPALYDAICVGRESGVDMALGTNGILYDTGKAGEKALENLVWLRFNISAADDAGYRRIHGSKEFETAIEKIKYCVQTKQRKNLAVTIGLQMVLTPSNVDQTIALAKLGRSLEVDYLVIKQCGDTVNNDLGVRSRLSEYHSFADIIAEAEAQSSGDYKVIAKWDKLTNEGKRNYDSCMGVPFLIYTSGEGKVFPCGMFFDWRSDEFCMGDLTKQSFKEIVESDRYWDVVKKVSEIDVHKICYSNCRTNSINSFLWQIKHPPMHVNFV